MRRLSSEVQVQVVFRNEVKPVCQDELPAKRFRKEPETKDGKEWVYSIEPHDPAIATWLELPKELKEVVEMLLLESPPKELRLPTSLVVGKNYAEVQQNAYKKWPVVENNLHTADRTAVVSLRDGKLRKKGVHMFIHFRWKLKSDASSWMARMGFGLWA